MPMKQLSLRNNNKKQQNTFTNIIGFLNTRSLFKKDEDNLNSSQKNYRNTLNLQLTDFIIQDNNNQLEQLNTAKHTIKSQKYHSRFKIINEKQQDNNNIQTARSQEPIRKFQLNNNNNVTQLMNLQNNSLSVRQKSKQPGIRTQKSSKSKPPIISRFYYKNQNDQYFQNQYNNQHQYQETNFNYQNQQNYEQNNKNNINNNQVYQGYIKHMNTNKKLSPNTIDRSDDPRKIRSVGLVDSRLKYFQNCRDSAFGYLSELRSQLSDNLIKISQIKQQINSQLISTIHQRASSIRQQLYDIVQQIVCLWQRQQYNQLKQKQLFFMGDILQIQQQINQRMTKIEGFIDNVDVNNNNIYKRNFRNKQFKMKNDQIDWKEITADLLLFNYQDGILQLRQLCDKLSIGVYQNCNRALASMSSSELFMKNVIPQILNFSVKLQLKQSVMTFLRQKCKINAQINQWTQKQLVKNSSYQTPIFI